MSVLEGSSVSCKTMADGTLRITIDIEPRNAQDAFALFGSPGRAVALAALKDGAAAIPSNPGELEKPKGGQWAKLAGMWCNDSDFWLWWNTSSLPDDPAMADANDAANVIRGVCDIASRAELDNNAIALATFNETFRYPFMKWMQARGIHK